MFDSVICTGYMELITALFSSYSPIKRQDDVRRVNGGSREDFGGMLRWMGLEGPTKGENNPERRAFVMRNSNWDIYMKCL